MDYIESKGQTENTLFVYVCDNGWVQNENDSRYNPISKRSPYDYGLRTPIMFKWKGKITPKMDEHSLVSSLDMMPAVLDMVGIDRPENLDGINPLNESELQARDAIFGEIYFHDFDAIDESLKYRMAITDPYKLILPDPNNLPDEEIQLFNIYQDPFEQDDLSRDHPEILEKLRAKIEKSWLEAPALP